MRKYALFILILFIVMQFAGCATTLRQSMQGLQEAQEYDVEFNHQMELFQQAKGLRSEDIPKLYDVSCLRTGSYVKTENMQHGLPDPYSGKVVLKTVLKNIHAEGGQKFYVTETTGFGISSPNDQISTHNENELAMSTLNICYPDFNFETLLEPPYVDDLLKTENLPTTVIQGAIMAGPLGILLGVMDYSNEKKRNEEMIKHIKGSKIKTKVIDFNLISNENLTIANKNIACKVYQVNRIRCQINPGLGRVPGWTMLTNESEKLWISDDVPFGVARVERIGTNRMCTDTNTNKRNRHFYVSVDKYTREVVEFSY